MDSIVEQDSKQIIMEDTQLMNNNAISLFVIGMAGTGKTTFMSQFYQQVQKSNQINTQPFMINLDPAVQFLPYSPNIDIRNTINYKDIMKKYKLGPNGAIMTSLNLFSAQFDTVLTQLEQKNKDHDLFVFDTPGQIEMFTWSASGQIFSSSVASAMPSAIIYVIDIVKCQNPNTFMSNMLFCISIFYKMKLPMIVVFNKCDIISAEKQLQWMNDYESFLDAVYQDNTYLSSLSRSMCLSLEEFYKDLNVVSVSSVTGFGFDKLFEQITNAKKDYKEIYLPDMLEKKKQNLAQNAQLFKELKNKDEMKKFEEDFAKFKILDQKLEKASHNFIDKTQAQKVTFNLEQEDTKNEKKMDIENANDQKN